MVNFIRNSFFHFHFYPILHIEYPCSWMFFFSATPGGRYSFLTILYWLWMFLWTQTILNGEKRRNTTSFGANFICSAKNFLVRFFFLQTFVRSFIIACCFVSASFLSLLLWYRLWNIFRMGYFPFVDNLLNYFCISYFFSENKSNLVPGIISASWKSTLPSPTVSKLLFVLVLHSDAMTENFVAIWIRSNV